MARCSQAKLQAQQELLQAKLEQLGPGEPQPVLLLQDDRQSTSSSVSCLPPCHCQPCQPARRAPHFRPPPPQAWPPADVCPWPQEQEREGGRTPTLEILKSHISGIFRPKFSVSGARPVWAPLPFRGGLGQGSQRCPPKPLPPGGSGRSWDGLERGLCPGCSLGGVLGCGCPQTPHPRTPFLSTTACAS